MIISAIISGFIIEKTGNGALGVIVFFVVFALLICKFVSEEAKDYQAWRNRRDYWANGGPMQYRKEKPRYTPKLTAPPQSSLNQPKVVKTTNGMVTLLPDGGCIVERADGWKHYVDKDGNVTELKGRR